MNIAEAKQQVKDAVEAYLTKDDTGFYRIDPARQRPLFLMGAPGIGKTAIMSQIAQEMKIGLVSYSMTHHTRQSALGLPFIVHREYKGVEFEASEYTMSEIVMAVYDFMEKSGVERGILFLDEINCVSETLYPSMLQFLQFKTFGRHRIPADWVVVCAGNPPEYNKSVHEFDIVTLDRLRKLEVEPDYAAWRAYALAKGVHPAILSFLEIKKENFYKVETTPSGKCFVTARGWDDLSEIIALFEATGKPVDHRLVVQYLQDDEIAEAFSRYYELFDKYRSDYQVDRIIVGDAEEEVVARAQAAPFDERLALLGLLLDGLGSRLHDVLEQAAALEEVRDALRDARSLLLAGGQADEVLGSQIDAREQAFALSKEAGLASPGVLREKARAVSLLKQLRRECGMARTAAATGEEAFEAVRFGYREFVGTLEVAIKRGSGALDNAFGFVERAFGGDREMLVFVTELTSRQTTARFINRFGCERYYANNSQLMVDDRHSNLLARIDKLDEDAGEDARAAGAGAGAEAEAAEDEFALRDYYQQAQFEYGFASLCKMTLPTDLAGKRALNIGCRRGKGVFKMSSLVGAQGHVTGIDWAPDYIAEATSRMERAWRDSGLPGNNMEFHVAYPENLVAAGVADGSMDVAFINSVVNLAYDPQRVFAELFRVLAPGGLLVCETVLADTPRDAAVVEGARALGNSIQAAMFQGSFETMLRDLGFQNPTYSNEYDISPTTGFKFTYEVEVAPSNEDVRFTALVAHVRKPQ